MTQTAGTGLTGFALALVLVCPAAAVAQTQASAWRVSAGYESFAFRDLARSKPPVDGSAVVWRGQGPALTVDYGWRRQFRLHRFEVTTTSNRGFVYDTGVSVTARPSRDSASFLFTQYDYRWYLRKAVGLAGLHGGVGVRGIGGRRTLRHNFGGGIELSDTIVTGTGAFVAVLRFTRFERFELEAEWTNGSTLAHGNQHHVADVTVDTPSWGGGWLTEIAVRGDVRLRPRLAAVFWAGRDGEGLLFNHRSHTATRARFVVGVTYAR